MNKIRVLLADDHQLVRAGFRALLKGNRSTRVVAEASDGVEALDQVKKHRPDVVLLDVAMPHLNGLEAVARIHKESPNTKVVILSMHANEEYVVHALRVGAVGYLVKDAAVRELGRAIGVVMKGGTYFGPQISGRVTEDCLARMDRNPGPLEKLTPRQREVMQLIVEGHNTKEIAFRLAVSVKTVEAHRTQLMQRLKINDIPSLVRQAMRSGLVPSEPITETPSGEG